MKASTLAAMLALIGCGRSNAPVAVSVPVPTPKVHTAEIVASPAHEDGYWLAGMENEAEAERFVRALRSSVERKDKAALIAAVRYPFTYWQNKKKKVYRNRGELAPHYDRIFTSKVIRAIREWEREGLFVNYQGAMISGGTVWFNKREDGVRIITVNN